ncbi:hypothetical protein LCGC14_0325880 [marine sediment metagenome]|uniref:Uncharacterized protein n=1 Tax=marine sediment metagenome TaxID=412755 RepID=A0A0F9U0I7_9ZZZZ
MSWPISELCEIQVLDFRSRGFTQQEIADILSLTPKVVGRIVQRGEPQSSLSEDGRPVPSPSVIRWFCSRFLAGWSVANNVLQPPVPAGNTIISMLEIPAAPESWFLSNGK